QYGQSREAMLRVARCESNLTPTAVNKQGGSYGLFQFKTQTWLGTPYAAYDIFDPRASALAAGWMWSVGRKGAWVCQ
ncbi:MAG TPA: transglycosylase SLT domain-containing protein, partial [Thermomicrobiales bacterium]|nr:transglycosylase SLT domain-containing protein [Thermomicrobiales bacterium]